jgi:hypothetical protein
VTIEADNWLLSKKEHIRKEENMSQQKVAWVTRVSSGFGEHKRRLCCPNEDFAIQAAASNPRYCST